MRRSGRGDTTGSRVNKIFGVCLCLSIINKSHMHVCTYALSGKKSISSKKNLSRWYKRNSNLFLLTADCFILDYLFFEGGRFFSTCSLEFYSDLYLEQMTLFIYCLFYDCLYWLGINGSQYRSATNACSSQSSYNAQASVASTMEIIQSKFCFRLTYISVADSLKLLFSVCCIILARKNVMCIQEAKCCSMDFY